MYSDNEKNVVGAENLFIVFQWNLVSTDTKSRKISLERCPSFNSFLGRVVEETNWNIGNNPQKSFKEKLCKF